MKTIIVPTTSGTEVRLKQLQDSINKRVVEQKAEKLVNTLDAYTNAPFAWIWKIPIALIGLLVVVLASLTRKKSR